MKHWKIGMMCVLWVATGCTSGVPLEDYPERGADAYCGLVETCGVGRLSGIDAADCRTLITKQFENALRAQFEAAIERGTLIYHPDLAGACFGTFETLGCDIPIAATPVSCRDAFEGTIPAGQPCSLDEECAGDAYCDGESCPDTAGTCTARVGDEGACTSTDACQNGLVCQAGTCRAPNLMSGRPCGGTSGTGCALDEACLGDTGEGGTCTPFSALLTRGLDEPCDARTYELCLPGLSCAVTGAGTGGVEQACKAVAASGGSCFIATPSMCPNGEYCDADRATGTFDGTCQALPGDGQACTEQQRCAFGLNCSEGICTAPRDNGEACETTSDCSSSHCESGVCVAPPLCTT